MRVIAVTLTIALLDGPAWADQPPGIPSPTICSLSGRICATRSATGVTVWRKLPRGRQQPLWRVRPKGTRLFVADDGRSIVDFYNGANLLALDAGPRTVMLTFHRPGRTAVRVSLGQIIRDISGLRRTVSHRSWASSFGYDAGGRFVVNTTEGRTFTFDPLTGRVVEP